MKLSKTRDPMAKEAGLKTRRDYALAGAAIYSAGLVTLVLVGSASVILDRKVEFMKHAAYLDPDLFRIVLRLLATCLPAAALLGASLSLYYFECLSARSASPGRLLTLFWFVLGTARAFFHFVFYGTLFMLVMFFVLIFGLPLLVLWILFKVKLPDLFWQVVLGIPLAFMFVPMVLHEHLKSEGPVSKQEPLSMARQMGFFSPLLALAMLLFLGIAFEAGPPSRGLWKYSLLGGAWTSDFVLCWLLFRWAGTQRTAPWTPLKVQFTLRTALYVVMGFGAWMAALKWAWEGQS